jgi:hypothetical protein
VSAGPHSTGTNGARLTLGRAYSRECKLVINTDKTIVISLNVWQIKNNLKPEIVFQVMDITYINETKFLGLHLTENVKSDVHITHVCNMLN